MNVLMVRATVKPERAAEAEAETRRMFAALNEARPAGVQYASCKLADGVTFVALVALEDPANNPLPAIPEWVAFQERLEDWRAAPPDIVQLTVVGSYGFFREDAMASKQSEVRALLDSRIEACRARDIDRLMSLYSPNIVYFDVVPPLHFTGAEAVRRNFQRWFDEYEGPIGLETHDLEIAVSGDVAFARMLHLDSGTRKNGIDAAIWIRSTVCFQRSEDKWLITHEHISLPVGENWSAVANNAP